MAQFSTLPADYLERTYAGVLGKIIGVYLGRPFEQWSFEAIRDRLGEVWYYVHDKLGAPLVVTDDDISGTFTFLRALADHHDDPNLTPQQIGESWLNYIIENRTILWWGGLGMSTEHTAYLRLKSGIPAPESGSIARNGQVVAEQIGAQIFIDGWGLIHPNDPEAAADFAKRAGSVSHDGVALDGAMAVAAMVAHAFSSPGVDALLDTAVGVLPPESLLHHVYGDLRNWHAKGLDYVAGFHKLREKYGYEIYGGGCHMVPNHAVIVHALLHGNGNFQRSLMVANTVGYDTDCNSANVGCIIGVHGGLAEIENGPDWRTPVADRILIPTADGGSTVTDAVRTTYDVVNSARRLRGESDLAPKAGARFHFSLHGSQQGFLATPVPGSLGVATVAHEETATDRALAIRFTHLAKGLVARATSATFPSPADRKIGGYGLYASPTLYPGQVVRAKIEAPSTNSGPVYAAISLSHYVDNDQPLRTLSSSKVIIAPGDTRELEWVIPPTEHQPIAEIGIEVTSDDPVNGKVLLHQLGWTGTPTLSFEKAATGSVWRDAWVNGVDEWNDWSGPYVLIQNRGTGLVSQGTREWTNYTAEGSARIHLAERAGLAAYVQGLRRYYAIEITPQGKAQLVKVLGEREVLAEADFPFVPDLDIPLSLTVEGNKLSAKVGDTVSLRAEDPKPLRGGAIGLVVTEGRVTFGTPSVKAL